MRIHPVLLTLAALPFAACLKPSFKPVEGGPVLKFSAEFDTAYHSLQVHALFKAATDRFYCKTFSLGEGILNPNTNDEYFPVPGPGAVVEVPLSLRNSAGCAWKLSSISLDDRGGPDVKCRSLGTVLFVPPKPEHGPDYYAPLPDTLDYRCETTPGTECELCMAVQGNGDYHLKPEGGGVLLRIHHPGPTP
jgi:hypothetical protein